MTLVEMQDRLRVNAERRFADDCNAFEALLRVTLESLKEIQEIETAWRDALVRNEMPFNPQFDQVLFDRYRAWLTEAEVRCDQLNKQQSLGCSPPSSDAFRRALEEIEDKVSMRARADIGAEAYRRMSEADDE